MAANALERRLVLAVGFVTAILSACVDRPVTTSDRGSADAASANVGGTAIDDRSPDAAVAEQGCHLIGCGPCASFTFDVPLAKDEARRAHVTFCRNADCVTAQPHREDSSVFLVGRGPDAGPNTLPPLDVRVTAIAQSSGTDAGTPQSVSRVLAFYQGGDPRNGDVYTLRVDGPGGGAPLLSFRQAVVYHESVRNTGPGPNCPLKCTEVSRSFP